MPMGIYWWFLITILSSVRILLKYTQSHGCGGVARKQTRNCFKGRDLSAPGINGLKVHARREAHTQGWAATSEGFRYQKDLQGNGFVYSME
jgi:hypothetical protein